MEKEFDVLSVMKVIFKLPHFKTKIPITYHCDFLRLHSPAHEGLSRAQLSSNSDSSDLEMHCATLFMLLEDLGVHSYSYLTIEDFEVCKKAIDVAFKLIERYNP